MTLLQLQEAVQGDIIAYLIIAIILGVLISRAVFSIGTFLRHARAQTKLLSMIAEKLGVEKDSIIQELKKMDNPKI